MSFPLGAALVIVTTCAACQAAPAALPPLRVPDCLGVNIHFTGREDTQVEKIAAAGFRFVRMDFVWGGIEAKKGEYGFGVYDELVDSLSQRGIRALFILDYGNGNYDNAVAPFSDEGRAAMAVFARASAEHFRGKGLVWELWNEPNIGFWSPKPNVVDYVKLAKAVYPAIKQGDPDALLIAPALSNWDHGWLERAFQLGLLNYADAISVHPYGSRKPEDAAVYVGWVRELIDRYASRGREYPIISGEWGYATHTNGISVERQSQYLVRMFLSNTMNGCPISIWYDWRDDGTNPDDREHNFGTVYNDFREKPAYVAMKTLSTELGGYSFIRRLPGRSDKDYVALFGKGDDYRVAVWTTAEPHTVTIPLDVQSATVVSLTGERRSVGVSDGALMLDISGEVQYVEPAAPSRGWAIEAAWDVAGAVTIERGEVVAKLTSKLNSMETRGTLSVSGTGLKTTTTPLRRGEAGVRTAYVWDGSRRPTVQARLVVDGLEQPLVRTVALDASALPSVEMLPPTTSELLLAVRRPADRAREPFRGRLVLGGKGLRLAKPIVPFELAAGESSGIVRVRMNQAPDTVFSLTCTMLDERGNRVLSVPEKRYSIVDAFTGGKPGDAVAGYSLTLEGSKDVEGTASLGYAKAPNGGPADVCAKLDYSAAAGWRYATLTPKSPMPIPGKPRTMKAWVKSDGGEGLFRLRVNDITGQVHQPIAGGMAFGDWRCIEADLAPMRYECWDERIDGRLRYPLTWNSLLLIDPMGREAKGSVYLGPVMVCYD